MKLAYIEWYDARELAGDATGKEAKEAGLVFMCTGGLLISEDGEVVRLAADYWTWEGEDGTKRERYRDITVLPVNAIKRRLEWET